MRTLEMTDDEVEAVAEADDGEFAYADWKESVGTVLEIIDDQLAPFGLEIVQVDTGGDEYQWKIEKREAEP